MSIRNSLLTAALALAPFTVGAQPVTGLYIAGSAGANWLERTDLLPATAANRATYGTGFAEFDLGYAVTGSLGYGFGNGLRVEVEGNLRRNDPSRIRYGFVGAPASSSGYVGTFGPMANILYDFVIPGVPLQPYIGAGAGYAFANYQRIVTRNAAGSHADIIGSEGYFAYQAILGVSYPVEFVPGLSVTAEYRYYATPDQTKDTAYYVAGKLVAMGMMDVSHRNHSALLGLRYAFNAPRPAPAPVAAPVPAAAPAPARSYLVFFDFDRADLTDRARQIIAEAAQAVNSTGTTRIEVAGHADRSGTPQYNQRLSQRRAEAVAAELLRRGVSRSAMSIQAFGESRPLVPTADGVREPQNRRVEIVLR